jgi:hypothetical protein
MKNLIFTKARLKLFIEKFQIICIAGVVALTGCSTMFSKRTYGEGWDWTNKNVAPSFSTTNLNKSLPLFSSKIAQLMECFEEAAEKKDVDIAVVLLKFTLDFIISGMFGGTTGAATSAITDEMKDKFIDELNTGMREYF